MTIKWRGPLLVLSLSALLAVAGCGSSDDSSSSSTGASASTQAAATTSDDGGTATEASGDDSGGGSDKEFCTKLESIGQNLQDQSALSDPQKLGEYFAQVDDALKSANPPAEINDQWNTLEDLFSTMAKLFKNVDFSDPSSLTGMQDDLQKFQDQAADLSAATTALSQYAADHCGGAF